MAGDDSVSSKQRRLPPLNIAVTGHRHFHDAATYRFVNQSIEAVLRRLLSDATMLCALSGLAEGSDTIFAEVALSLHIPLIGVIAADDLVETFAPGPARNTYLSLCRRARQRYVLPFRHAGPAAYAALGQVLVDQCDVLLAAWNGRPAQDAGGTGGVVAYARACRKPLVHLHTLEHTSTWERMQL
jgi:hypothetical protein